MSKTITALGTHPMRIAGGDWLGLDGLTCLGSISLASDASAQPVTTATTMAARSAATPAEGGRVVVAVVTG